MKALVVLVTVLLSPKKSRASSNPPREEGGEVMRPLLLVSALLVAACPGGGSQPPASPTLPPASAPPATPTEVAEVAPPPETKPPAPELPPDPEPWRTERPEAGEAVTFTPPAISRVTLKNGVPVYIVENHALPLAAVQLIVRVGSSADPTGQEGVASLTANLLDEGAGKRGALAIAEEKDALGTQLVTSATPDSSMAQIDALTANLPASLDLLADVVLRPTFDAAEVERVRNDVVNELRQQTDSGPLTARNVLGAVAYGAAHPYGHPVQGTPAGVAALGVAEVKAFHAAWWRPEHAAIVVVGDVKAAAITAELEKRFGAWKGTGEARKIAPPEGAPVPKGGSKIYLVDRAGAQQGDVLIGAPALSRLHDDWIPVEVMNRVLGGSFYSRLNLNLREDKGATYGARSGFSSTLGPGLFTAGGGMVLDKTILAVSETLKEIAAMSSRPATEEELRRAKDAATLGLAARFETNASIAGAIAEVVVYDLPLDYYTKYVTMVQSVTATQVTAAAKKWLKDGAAHIVVVGPAATLEKALGKIAPVQRRDAYGNAVK